MAESVHTMVCTVQGRYDTRSIKTDNGRRWKLAYEESTDVGDRKFETKIVDVTECISSLKWNWPGHIARMTG